MPSVVSALNAPCFPEPPIVLLPVVELKQPSVFVFFNYYYYCTILPSVDIIQDKKLMGSRARSLLMMISKPPFKKTFFQAKFYLNSQHFSILETFVAIAVLVCILTRGETQLTLVTRIVFGICIKAGACLSASIMHIPKDKV